MFSCQKLISQCNHVVASIYSHCRCLLAASSMDILQQQPSNTVRAALSVHQMRLASDGKTSKESQFVMPGLFSDQTRDSTGLLMRVSADLQCTARSSRNTSARNIQAVHLGLSV